MRGAAMSLTAAASGFVVFLLSVSVVQAQNDWGVTYASTHICALKGSTVEIHSTYRYPSRINNADIAVDETLWFTKLSNNEPVDLRTDSEYAGRVQYHCDKNDCTLRITDLRERDSAEYKFMFITNQPEGKYTGSPGVTLTVTDFQVQVIPSTHSSNAWEKLECNSSCNLSDHSSFVWYNNGKEFYRGKSLTYSSHINHADSYSCSAAGYEDFPSLPVYAPKSSSVSVKSSSEIKEGSSVTLTCRSDANPEAKYTWYKSRDPKVISGGRQLVFKSIKASDSGEYYCTAENGLGKKTSEYTSINVKSVQGQDDWGVTYTSTHICALKGSTVDINCTYRYPSRINNVDTTVDETIWFTKLNNSEPVDLRTDSEYAGRVQYLCGKNDCTLRITDLRERDSAEYKFKFTTNQEGKYTGSAGVTLTVTDLQVQVIGATACRDRTCGLKCNSSCHLDDHPSYVWYKNGQMIMEQTSPFYLGYFHPKDSYSCALKGHEMFSSPSLYAHKMPSVSVSPSGEIINGSSVTLTCSSDNPAAYYTWYKKNVNPDLQPLSKEPQLVFSSIQSSDSGKYYCTVENRMGKRTSEYIFIDVKYAPKLPSVSESPSDETMENSSVTLTYSTSCPPDGSNLPSVKGNSVFTINTIRLILVVLVLIALLLMILWTRKKKTLSSTTDLNEPVETIELDSYPVYEDVSDL